MGEDLVGEIIDAEQKTADIQKKAQLEVDHIIATAKQEASSIREQTLAKARKQAQEMIEKGKRVAAEARTEILAQTHEEISQLQTEVDANVEAAIAYVVRQVLGQ